jgi:carbon storage regulator
MLVLTRNVGTEVVINSNIVVSVLNISNGQVRLGIEAPKDISVHRKEIQQKIDRGNNNE